MGQLLARISRRNIATTTLMQMIATVDIWTQSGTGVSRKPSESVFLRLVLRRAGGASARNRPTKVCDWVQVRWPRSRVFFKFFDIFRSIVASSFHVIQKFNKNQNKNEHSIFLLHHHGMGKIRCKTRCFHAKFQDKSKK